jgi:hypothetical protein
MSDEIPTPQDDGKGDPAPPKGAPPIPSGGGTNWESSYKGLQKTYDKLFAEHQALVATHESTVGELEALKADKRQGDSNATSLHQQIVSKDTEIERLTKEVTANAKKAGRSALIIAEFSDLSSFEGEGLLPDAETDEELKTKLTKFRETIGKTVGTEVDKKIRGSGPPPVGKQPPPTLDADEIYERLVALAGSQDPQELAEYQKLLKQWHDLQKTS